MRILAASARGAGRSIADDIAAAGPEAAAISCIAPSDAAALAYRLCMRCAVQCWETPDEGKAILWNADLAQEGLHRAEFDRQPGDSLASPAGLLRVTFAWRGLPLHVYSIRFSPDLVEAQWQAARAVRDLQAAGGRAMICVDGASTALSALADVSDVWEQAPFRTVTLPHAIDVATAARAALGIARGEQPASVIDRRSQKEAPIRILCAGELEVSRTWHRAFNDAARDDYAIVADVTAPAIFVDDDVRTGHAIIGPPLESRFHAGRPPSAGAARPVVHQPAAM